MLDDSFEPLKRFNLQEIFDPTEPKEGVAPTQTHMAEGRTEHAATPTTPATLESAS